MNNGMRRYIRMDSLNLLDYVLVDEKDAQQAEECIKEFLEHSADTAPEEANE